jgi:hypothetical protein
VAFNGVLPGRAKYFIKVLETEFFAAAEAPSSLSAVTNASLTSSVRGTDLFPSTFEGVGELPLLIFGFRTFGLPDLSVGFDHSPAVNAADDGATHCEVTALEPVFAFDPGALAQAWTPRLPLVCAHDGFPRGVA